MMNQKGTKAVPYDQRDNTGTVFRNDRKSRATDRDYAGSATIGGTEYWISGWIKEGRNGKFMSFSFKPKNESKGAGARVDFDDVIPF